MNAALSNQPSFHAHLIGNNIICFSIPDGALIDVQEVEEMHKVSLSHFGNKPYGVLFKAEHGLTVTPEAQRLGKELKYQKGLVAQAILINSLAQRILGNFIIRLNRRPSVNRLFTDEQEALAWLKGRMEKVGE